MYDSSNNIYFDIVIGGISLNIKEENLVLCELIETAGIELPTVELVFTTYSVDVRKKIIENNPIQIRIGTSVNSYDTFTIDILSKDIGSTGSTGFACYITGFLASKKFLLNKAQAVVSGTSLEGIQELSDLFSFNLDTDIYSVNDSSQKWLICNESYREMLVDMWVHMDIQPSFPLVALNRWGDFLLKDFKNIVSSTPKWTFMQNSPFISSTHRKFTQQGTLLTFISPFTVSNDVEIYNLYAGYGKLANIYDSVSGDYDVHLHDSDNSLGTSKVKEASRAGNRMLDGFFQNGNVHHTYHNTYLYNVAKLIQISSIWSHIDFVGMYNREINLLDYVNVVLTESDADSSYSGKYIINTIVYSVTGSTPFTTRVYVSRDSINDLENSVVLPDTGIKVDVDTKTRILKNAKRMTNIVSILNRYLSGTLQSDLISHLSSLKYNALSSFSINDVTINLNSQASALQSLINFGNSIQTRLMDMYIPYNTQILLGAVGWGDNPDLLQLLHTAIQTYTPYEIADLYEELLLTFNLVSTKINDLNQDVEIASGEGITMLDSTTSNDSDTVSAIVDEITANVEELDIPIPIVTLTESETLMSDAAIKELIASQIITHLLSLGYLTGVDPDYFKSILVGDVLLDAVTASTILTNISSTLYTRYWGVYSSEDDLSDYNIRKGYSDYTRLVDCTKTLSVTGGKNIYFAIPTEFVNNGLTFYISGTETELEMDSVDLLIFDKYGNKIPYAIYTTSIGYNSSNVSLQVVGN